MEKSKLFTGRVKFATLDASVCGIEYYDVHLIAKNLIRRHGFADRSKYDFKLDEDSGLIHIYILWDDVEI